MKPLKWIQWFFDAGYFGRCLVIFQFWFCYFIVDWSMAFASTALAMCAGPKCELTGAAANIAAVAAIPQMLLMMATKFYMDSREKTPVVIADRRVE